MNSFLLSHARHDSSSDDKSVKVQIAANHATLLLSIAASFFFVPTIKNDDKKQ